MKIDISKYLLFVMTTTAAAVAADSSSTLATKVAIEGEKSLLNNDERATTEQATTKTTTTTSPEGFAASSLSSLSSSSSLSTLVEVFGADDDDVLAQRKLSKSSKKVKHPEALCTLSLFADSLFMYANQCFTDIMVTISACDDKDDTCYISEQLPLLPQEQEQEQEQDQEEEQCFVGGLFPARQNIRYNPSTGDCEFLYVDLTDDPCNMYNGDTGTGSLGLKARINVQHNPDVMFIQFTNNKGLTFYNDDDERVADRLIDRYLRQERETQPVLSMTPHPFASHHRRMKGKECNAAIFNGNIEAVVGYSKVTIKNNTPYRSNYMHVEYLACADDENNFIASGGTWTGPYRGGCLIHVIRGTLILHDDSELKCNFYDGKGTGYSEFYIMLIDGVCCLRSWAQDSDKCPEYQKDNDNTFMGI